MDPKRSSFLGALLAVSASLTGCSILLEADSNQCETDGDCLALGDEFAQTSCNPSGYCVVPRVSCQNDNDCAIGRACSDEGHCVGEVVDAWACMDPARPKLPSEGVENSSRTVDLVLPLLDITGPAVRNRELKVCAVRDTECSTPYMTVTSDVTGTVRFQLPANFDGFIESPGDEQYFAEIYELPTPLPTDGQLPTMEFVSPEVLAMHVENNGYEADPARGFLVVTVQDCTGEWAGGLEISTPTADENTLVFYHFGNPLELTETQAGYGRGNFSNLKAGSTVVDVKYSGTEQVVWHLPTIVRPNTLTSLYVLPPSRTTPN